MQAKTRAARLWGAAVVLLAALLAWRTNPATALRYQYEFYNNKPVASGEYRLQSIRLPGGFQVQRVTAQQARSLQNGVLVLAYPTCPYCRNLMPELAAAAKAAGVKLYYCELDQYRDVYTYDKASGTLAQTKPAGEGYAALLAWLDEYAHEYRVRTPDGSELPVGEKRLGAPTLVRVRENQPVSGWKLSSVQDVNYPKNKYECWDAETQERVYASLLQYLNEENET